MTFRLTALFLSVFMLAGLSATPAAAIGEDVFVVPRVTVQAEAANATAAKAAAQRLGRRKAMEILLRRLTVEEDWPDLPQLPGDAEQETQDGDATAEDAQPAAPSAAVDYNQPYDSQVYQGQPQIADPYADAMAAIDAPRQRTVLTDRDLELLESSFEVYNEKSSSTTYRAYITYRFKPDAVRRLLKDAGIAYSEAQTRTALVLPILQTANGLYLWEANNPWMAAWKVRPYDNELTPMIAPLGDLEDSATITAKQALALDEDALKQMAERYSVSQVVVAHAFLQQVDGEDRLRVRLINGFRESGNIDAMEELGVDDSDAAYKGRKKKTNADDFITSKVGDVLAEDWFSQPSGGFPVLAERSIDDTIAQYAKPWKQRTLIDYASQALLAVSAHYRSLAEWTQIRAALVSTPLVGSVQVRSLSRTGADMLIQAYGDPGKLAVAMEAQGLALWSEDGDHWLIATPSTAQGVRGAGDRGRNIFGSRGNDAQTAYRPASMEETDDNAPAVESQY